MIRGLMLCVAMCLPVAAGAVVPVPYTADYDVLRNGSALGTATVVYKALGNGRYELHSVSVAKLAGITAATVDERSTLAWKAATPETITYNYRQEVPFKSRTRNIRVDAAAGHILSEDKKDHYTIPYQAGVLDRNAVTVALMQDVASGRADLRYAVANKDEIETQVYRSAAPERIDTALGAQRAVRVERIRESANGRSTTLWLGADRNFVPLRILQREPEGETIEMRIRSIH